MGLQLTPQDMITIGTLLVTIAAAFVTVRADVKAAKDRINALEAELEKFESEVEKLKGGQLTVALLEQAVSSLNATAFGLREEAQATRASVETMGRALVRIETRLDMKSHPIPDAP